jgi:Na+/melibiose symporter-like transporter
MFPTVVRGRAMGISVLFSNIGQFIVNFSFLPLVDSIGDSGTFLFYFAVSVVAALYIGIYVVETAEKDPASILSDLTGRSLAAAMQSLKSR